MKMVHTTTKKSTAMKKKRPKQLLKKAIDYLFSDDYMFSPLLSSSSSNIFSSSSTSSPAGIDETAEVNDKDSVEKVGDYLKSDCYLYSPLVITQPWLNSCATQKGLHHLLEKNDTRKSDDSLKAADKTEKRIKDIAASVDKERNFDSLPHDPSTVVMRARVQRETVKRTILRNCHPVTGEGFLGKDLGMVVE